MKYKISDAQLKLREYGRNIQMMVDYARTLDDDQKRQSLIEEIVRIMANINPIVREQPDYKQVLWDHVFFLGEYKLDVTSPYPVPTPDSHNARPSKRMEYYQNKPRYKQYGSNVDLLIKEAKKMDDREKQLALVELVANIMRIQLTASDKDHNAELTTVEHLKVMLKGNIDFNPEEIKFWNTPPPKAEVPSYQRTPNRKKRKNRKPTRNR